MGFLRKLFPKSFDDCGQMIRSLDERVSKIEGVGGNYEPKSDIKSGKKRSVSNLRNPTDKYDASRYTNEMRYVVYSSGPTAGTLNISAGASGHNYDLGQGRDYSNNLLTHVTPVNLKFHKLHFSAVQLSATNNQTIRFIAAGDGTGPRARYFSATIHSKSTLQNYYRATVVTDPYLKSIPRGASLAFFITNSQSSRWANINFIAEFLVEDK